VKGEDVVECGLSHALTSVTVSRTL